MAALKNVRVPRRLLQSARRLIRGGRRLGKNGKQCLPHRPNTNHVKLSAKFIHNLRGRKGVPVRNRRRGNPNGLVRPDRPQIAFTEHFRTLFRRIRAKVAPPIKLTRLLDPPFP